MSRKDNILLLLTFAIVIIGCIGIYAMPSYQFPEAGEYESQLKEESEHMSIAESAKVAPAQECVTVTYPEQTKSDVQLIPAYTLDKSITLEEFELMCRIVMNESGGEPFQTQVAVAETIVNRINSDKFPNTVMEVLYQPYQYSHANNGEVTDSVREAVTSALEQHIYDTDMMYFREDYYHEFAEDYFYINNMYFSRCYELENGEFVEVE